MKVLIIAEAGVNHNGSIELAKKLIEVAADANADYVKFQTFITENNITKYAEKASYQKERTNKEESQFDMIKKLELDCYAHKDLIKYCKQKDIQFLSTAFDHESIELLAELEISLYKIPSGEITNLPYLRRIGQYGKPVFLSTGMANQDEIEAALNVLEQAGTSRKYITVLHCNTEYPTPTVDVNLKAMLTLQDAFNVRVGYSDHTLGIEVAVAAVALGATVIEKHLTLDCNLPGPDHKASLEPEEFKAMVVAIRNIEKAMGDGVKRPSPSETKNKPIARKSLVAAQTIRKGELFCETNLAVKRPGTGLSPMRWDEVLGSKAPRDFEIDELIEL